MAMTDLLPIVATCDGCSACCREQESPPGYVAMIARGVSAWPDIRDRIRFERMPEALKEQLRRYIADLLAGKPRSDEACIWLDRENNRCRHYEWRPEICRNFEVGCSGCLRWREKYGDAS